MVRGTMILATMAWAVGEALMRRSPRLDRFARAAWTAGIALALLHVVLAFHVVYGWSHAAAVHATVRQTVDRFGWGWSGGIYVNYLFLTLWLADVLWWWIAPAVRAARPAGLETGRRLLFAFMFLNGAVVFASGPARVAGIAALALVLFASWSRRPQVHYVHE